MLTLKFSTIFTFAS